MPQIWEQYKTDNIRLFEKSFKTVKKYVVYLDGSTSDENKISIMDLLSNLLSYVTANENDTT